MILLSVGGPSAPDDIVFKAMRDELSRSMQRLRLDTLPAPYFIAYRLSDQRTSDAEASFGSLVRSNDGSNRAITVELRVGDYAFDNTNFAGPGGQNSAQGPLEDDYVEIRRHLWLATDAAYKSALEQISQKRAALRNVTRTEDLPDFSREPKDSIVDDRSGPLMDRSQREAMTKELSALFRQMPDVFYSNALWTAAETHTRYLNSEGTTFQRRITSMTVRIAATTQAQDGSSLQDAIEFRGARAADLPAREQLRAAALEMGKRLSALRTAPLVDQYNGPVLFEDQAAAEAFNIVFTPRLVATRRPVSRVPGSGQGGGGGDDQFLDLIGARVLPAFLSVTDDPTQAAYRERYLGARLVDDDGVRSRPTVLVERGILKTLLSTRVPVRGIAQSTGSRSGSGAVVRNVFVRADGGVPAAELRKKLLEIAAQRNREYGIVIRRIATPGTSSGLDLASMMMMAQMGTGLGGGGGSLRAIEAYRVFLDGRQELIRNAEVMGISPSTFKEIVAASDSVHVVTTTFRGPGGAGAATYIVPSVLFEEISVRGPRGEIPKPPVAKHPFFDKP